MFYVNDIQRTTPDVCKTPLQKSVYQAILCKAKKLFIFSDIDGLYDSNPHLHPNNKLISKAVSR